MAETEVESILREIRERVLSQQRSGKDVTASAAARSAMANGTNGTGCLGHNETVAAENLALINSYLTTTARAWDRLPPLVSNRSGLGARLELWLKRRLRAGTRWFTWEQVNFNAAVNHALRDLLQVLSAHEQELGKLRVEADARRIEFEQMRADLVRELRERDEHLHDEQRVCFKQLALETSEAAVLEDRARRQNETLLQELSRRIEKFEKK
jgi:hypothetical protein